MSGTTLYQVTLPSWNDIFSVGLGVAGLLMFGFLVWRLLYYGIVQRDWRKAISPYIGLPYIGLVVLMGFLIFAGKEITLTGIGWIVGYIVKITSTIFIWPFLILGIAAYAIHIFRVITYGEELGKA